MQISVIICTHNPRQDYLKRTLDGLRAQALPMQEWELLLIDNASNQPLSGCNDLSWHPHARTIREDEIGLTPARLCGIRESTGTLLVFVDDDNVLDAAYLKQARELAARWPMIGVFGGSCEGEYEVTPKASIRPFLSSLAVWKIDREHWSNAYEWSLATPYGAGMCVRREVVAAYTRRLETRPFLKTIDRRGAALTSGGDHDIVWTAIELGFGSARFPSLKLMHLISKGRLTEEYMLKLHAGFEFSSVILAAYQAEGATAPRKRWTREMRKLAQAYLHKDSFSRRIEIAKWKARQAAIGFLHDADSNRMRGIQANGSR